MTWTNYFLNSTTDKLQSTFAKSCVGDTDTC